jgi:predicted glycosyltransferase
MRIQVFTNTPAHVHLYKHAVRELQRRGHEVLVLARDYGCTLALLDAEALPYVVYGRCGTTKGSLARNLPRHYVTIARETLRFRPDLIFGMGSYAAHAGALSRTPVVLVLDSDIPSIDHRLATPFARAVLTPAAFTRSLGERHHVFDGFKESAYLHPEVFEPDPSVREALGVATDEPFVILRFNAFGSHHDVNKSGFTPAERRTLVEELAAHATVFVSDEGGDLDLSQLPARAYDLHPARLHDALAEASLLVADTQTMVTEAALLGTPAIRSNAFVGEGDMGNFVEIANAGLIYNLEAFDDVLERAVELLADPSTERTWERRRDRYVAGMSNLSEIIVDLAEAEGYPGSVPAIRPMDRADKPRHTVTVTES